MLAVTNFANCTAKKKLYKLTDVILGYLEKG